MAKLATSFSQFIDKPNFSVVFNTEGLYFITHEPRFREVVAGADLIFVDGIGLKLALQFTGYENVQRLHGPDLFHRVLHQDHGKRQLIVGGSDRSHELLVEKYPNLKDNELINMYSAMVKEDDLSDLFAAIDEFKPDLIWVCLGIRKQEYIGQKIREKYPQCSIVGIGASIDFESGNVIRSSVFWQKIGFEWLPRLIREPRMIPRQTRALFGFLRYSLVGFLRFLGKSSLLRQVVEFEKRG